MNEELLRRVEALESFKKSLEKSSSIPLNITQAFSERFKSKILMVKSTLNFGSIGGGASATLTVPLGGIKPNDPVLVSAINAITTGVFFTGYVESNGVLTIRCDNFTANPINPNSAEFNIAVFI